MTYGEGSLFLLTSICVAYLAALVVFFLSRQRHAFSRSYFLLFGGAGAAFLIAAVVGLLTPPRLFLVGASMIGAARVVGALAHLVVQAALEEASKAAGIAMARPRANAVSWFWITAGVAAFFGLVERLLMGMNQVSRTSTDLALLFALDFRGIATHVALSLVCITVARGFGGSGLGWTLGITAASVLHALANFIPRRLPAEFQAASPLADEAISGVLAIAVIVVAYAFRQKLDWRR